ncbi:hypothetical protein [Tabrizicola sp.]|uniref:hypothetical protein n=1 Tax=Tabrizicola sp. TaxID=2005166 RepID=UPI0027374EE1|nr:hypothetical protein [Tabrizicola sp.]MDP3195736.1 hypothetical protein [Tabrizicola sp.]
MDLVSSIRSLTPVLPSVSQQVPDRATSVAAAQSARPVTDTLRREAVHQPAGLAAQIAVDLAERDEDHHPAAEARAVAAQAARDAYIKASIAAGLSPLPLP